MIVHSSVRRAPRRARIDARARRVIVPAVGAESDLLRDDGKGETLPLAATGAFAWSPPPTGERYVVLDRLGARGLAAR